MFVNNNEKLTFYAMFFGKPTSKSPWNEESIHVFRRYTS